MVAGGAGTAWQRCPHARQHAGLLGRRRRSLRGTASLDPREYLAWKYVRDNADGVLNLAAQQRQQTVERLDRADRTGKDRLLGAYHWALVPAQPDPTRPLQLEPIKAEGGRTAWPANCRQAHRSPELVLRRASAAIRLDLDTTLATVFDRDAHISLGALWDYYTTYPLARLRTAKFSKPASSSTLDTPIDWQHRDSPSLTTGTGVATGLLPTDPDRPSAATVDSLLLVQPRRLKNSGTGRNASPEPGPGPDRTCHRGQVPVPTRLPGPVRIRHRRGRNSRGTSAP